MSARLLLDTTVALWALAAPARLGREARELLDRSEVYVSAATVLALALQEGRPGTGAEILRALEPSGLRPLAVTAEHAAAADRVGEAGEPLARLVIAQAALEAMTLVTADGRLAAALAAPSVASRRGTRRRGARPAAPLRPAVVLAADAVAVRRRR
ncbi:MAG: PIN domain-containing protein [Proteobacteria bacterium]|nr:PIN domain-containing protein [Pseudomonadota bacterium]